MLSALQNRPKVALLQGAARRGPRTFLRQAGLVAADSLLRKKHLVFRLDAPDLPPVPASPGLTFREIASLDGLHPADRELILAPGSTISWGDPDWFDRGWRLWIVEEGGRLVALGWWRNAEQSRDFFIPVPPDGELLWHATVLPALRGRNLHAVLRLALMHQRASQGVRCFFTNCRDYNAPSHRNILRMGFTQIGHVDESKISGKRRWHPAKGEGATA